MMRLPERRVQIDVDARANGRTYSSALFVHGDSALTLAGLADRLEGQWRADAGFGAEIGRKTVAMCGDGGFLLNLGELWTAVQEQTDICFLVMNDKGYGVVRHIQDASYGGRQFFCDLLGPNLEDLAKLAGLPFWRVRSTDELGRHLAAALQKRGPTLVEVDMSAIGPFKPLHQPPAYAGKR